VRDEPDSNSETKERPTVKVSQADTKRLLAIKAHLEQLIRTAMHPDRKTFYRPVEMDQGELLLAAASLRALIFDTGAQPLLIRLFEDAGLDIKIETVETNLGLVLLSELIPEPGHVSDYIAGAFMDPQQKETLPLDKPQVVVIFHEKPDGLEEMLKRPDIWVPSAEKDAEEIQSSLTHMTNVGPGQLLRLTRRSVSLSNWGNTRIGYLKDIAITRRNIIEYVANRLGGVHYDSKRSPKDPSDVAQFHVLATAYDWNDQALMHAGFVAVGLACLEILNTPSIYDIYRQCERLLAKRQRALIERATAAMNSAENNPQRS